MRTKSSCFHFFIYRQDFELWDDVGLNIPKPPDLLQLYRNCGTPLLSPRDTADASVGVDPGDLPGNCDAQDSPRKPDAARLDVAKVCVCHLLPVVDAVASAVVLKIGLGLRLGSTC